MVWAVLFMIFPPFSFLSDLTLVTRSFWLIVTFIGATLAFLGAVTRIDIKLELPGLLITLIGPLFYFLGQLYYAIWPFPGDPPNSRIAILAYALLPGLLLLPRTFALYWEARRLKRITTNNRALSKELSTAKTFLAGKEDEK